MSGHRKEKVSEQLRSLISSEILRYGFPGSEKITISSVDITPDLRHAKIFWQTHDRNHDLIMKNLKHFSYKCKQRISEELHLKYIPELRFIYDGSVEYASHIDSLLDTVSTSSKSESEEK